MVTAPRASTRMTVLVTGGAGFIGSHTCVELLDQGHQVVVIDDHSNSHPVALQRVELITGRPVTAYAVDLRDGAAMSDVFRRHPIDAVIHFAAKKAVGESTQIPLEYYDINVGGTVVLLRVMAQHGVSRLVFSSSCSIYGDTTQVPLAEDAPAAPTNPYARSKWMCEQVLADACRRDRDLSVIALRYFNPVGAHPGGLLGEDPYGVPNNLMPYLAQVAVGWRTELNVFGDDYPTADGTGVRDYIHVADVANAHRVALDHLTDTIGFQVFNLGTGVGTSVLQLVAAFREASGHSIPVRIVGRRPGDVAELVADPSRVAGAWGWRTSRDVAAMCRDAIRFQRLNPAGYADSPLPIAI
jgi:UDP-glucose 4-epimerase